jgi:penicillin-binding protein 2
VVLDAKTGAVYAIASYPSYDPSVWVGGISERQFRWLANEKNGVPLISRAIQGMFPPASTFKVITAAAAAAAGFSMDAIYQCPSTFRVGDRDFGNFGLASYGAITMQRAMEVSCDTIFYQFAYKLWLRDGGQEPEGPVSDDIENMSRAFGLGARTGIDLLEEVSGRVGGRDFRQKNWEQNKEIWCKRGRDGYPEIADTDAARAQLLQAYAVENCDHGYLLRGGDAVNLAIGQGDTVVTPLQMAVVYAAIANDGRLVTPHIGKAIVSSTGEVVRSIEPETAGKLPVSRKTMKYLQESLPGVVTRGTAAGAFVGFPNDVIPVAGKTGTGEVVAKGDTAWFVGYAPVSDPRYVVAVTISQGGTGGGNAAPAVRGILEAIYGVSGPSIDPATSVFIGGAPARALPQIQTDGQVVPPSSDSTYQPPKPRLPTSPDSGLPLISLPQLVTSPRANQEQKKPNVSESSTD